MIRTLLAGFAFAIAITAQAQSDLASYAGADRMERLAAAAKKEGGFTLYTSFAEKDLPTLIPPFEKKYGVKVKVWRASTVRSYLMFCPTFSTASLSSSGLSAATASARSSCSGISANMSVPRWPSGM